MKFLALLVIFYASAFASTPQFQPKVVELIKKSIYFGDFESYSDLEFIGVNSNGHETYKLSYTYTVFGDGSSQHQGMDVDEIIGTESECEYIYYDAAQSDFFFTGFACSTKESIALGSSSEFAHNEAEISEVLQTDPSFSFVLDYGIPTYIETIEDEFTGNIEIYKLEYVNTDHEGVCEYVTFDPEINYLVFTGVTCDKPVDYVIDEGLREID